MSKVSGLDSAMRNTLRNTLLNKSESDKLLQELMKNQNKVDEFNDLFTS
jgi:hypothetical protein